MGGYLRNYLFFLLLYIMIPWTQTVRYCGNWICHGAAYCCGDYLDQCCFYSQIYQFWWFWLIWAGVFFVLATCSYLCWRQKTERSLLMHQPNNNLSGQVSASPNGPNLGGMATPPPPYQNYQQFDIPGQPPVMMSVPPAYEEVSRKYPAPTSDHHEKDKWSDNLSSGNTFSSHPFTISTGVHSLNSGILA